MAFPFGRQIAGRALLGASTTQIRGYCQKVSSTFEYSPRRASIMLFAGAVTSNIILYITVHTKLYELREKCMLDSPKVEYSWRIQHGCSLESEESTQLRNDLAIAFCQDKVLLPFISVALSQMKLDSAGTTMDPIFFFMLEM